MTQRPHNGQKKVTFNLSNSCFLICSTFFVKYFIKQKLSKWIFVVIEPCHKEVTCSIEGEFCVNNTCKCGVFGGPSCEGKATGDYCKADFSTCSCSADSLGECPSGYSCDTKHDTCVRSNY